MDAIETATQGQAGFGALLKRYRLAAGLTQEALAERAGLSARAVSAYERGLRQAPYRDTVGLLVQALGLSPEEATTLEAVAGTQGQPVRGIGARRIRGGVGGGAGFATGGGRHAGAGGPRAAGVGR